MHFSAASGIIFNIYFLIPFAMKVAKTKIFYLEEKIIHKYEKPFLGLNFYGNLGYIEKSRLFLL